MFESRKKYLMVPASILLAIPIFSGSVFASDGMNQKSAIENTEAPTFASPQDVEAYWTAERMANAIPLPVPQFVMPEGGDDPINLQFEQQESFPEDLVPHVAPGWRPGSGPEPDPSVGIPLSELSDPMDIVEFQTYGSAPTNPKDGPYAPFQRWTWYGAYTNQDTQTIGKLFFTDGTYNYSCTATVISPRTIATAAHCLHQGGGGSWYSGWQFCPSYNKNGVNPSRGCWSWNMAKVSSAWVNTSGGAADRDYACIVTSSSGDTIANNVGYVTGWSGRAWNFASEQPIMSFGYPGESPFPGYHIIAASSPEWYEVNMTSGDGLVSKYMGNDMTGGSSGGPWWFGVAHRVYEYPDTDGSNATDPHTSGPYLNGVNSHKRCLSFCYEPPGTTYGTFWQEMGSPQFRNTTADTDESEDVFAACLNYE